jgi:hypothetical protein
MLAIALRSSLALPGPFLRRAQNSRRVQGTSPPLPRTRLSGKANCTTHGRQLFGETPVATPSRAIMRRRRPGNPICRFGIVRRVVLALVFSDGPRCSSSFAAQAGACSPNRSEQGAWFSHSDAGQPYEPLRSSLDTRGHVRDSAGHTARRLGVTLGTSRALRNVCDGVSPDRRRWCSGCDSSCRRADELARLSREGASRPR